MALQSTSTAHSTPCCKDRLPRGLGTLCAQGPIGRLAALLPESSQQGVLCAVLVLCKATEGICASDRLPRARNVMRSRSHRATGSTSPGVFAAGCVLWCCVLCAVWWSGCGAQGSRTWYAKESFSALVCSQAILQVARHVPVGEFGRWRQLGLGHRLGLGQGLGRAPVGHAVERLCRLLLRLEDTQLEEAFWPAATWGLWVVVGFGLG